MNREHLLWATAIAVVVAIFYLSGDGFYRYPCQDPVNWGAHECNPPLCVRIGMCTSDLTGAVE